jgi:hypothetical protein
MLPAKHLAVERRFDGLAAIGDPAFFNSRHSATQLMRDLRIRLCL